MKSFLLLCMVMTGLFSSASATPRGVLSGIGFTSRTHRPDFAIGSPDSSVIRSGGANVATPEPGGSGLIAGAGLLLIGCGAWRRRSGRKLAGVVNC